MASGSLAELGYTSPRRITQNGATMNGIRTLTEWLTTFDNGQMHTVMARSELDAIVATQQWRTDTGHNVASGYGIHDVSPL